MELDATGFANLGKIWRSLTAARTRDGIASTSRISRRMITDWNIQIALSELRRVQYRLPRRQIRTAREFRSASL
jgi:hypothetical protein